MASLKLPSWLSLLYTSYQQHRNKQYFQALLKHIHLARSYVLKQIKGLEAHHIIRRITDPKDSRIKYIEFTPKGVEYMSLNNKMKKYYHKNKKGEYELKDFEDVE